MLFLYDLSRLIFSQVFRSMLFSFSQLRESVRVCVSGIRALGTACALISCSQTWGNMSARIQYQPFQLWANGLSSERAEKQTRMTQTRTPIHTSPFYLRRSLSVGDLSLSIACVWVRTVKSINHILYSTGELVRVTSLSIPLFTNWQVNVLKATLIKKRAYNHFVYHNKPLF